MENHEKTLKTLAAICEQKLMTDPHNPRRKRLECDLARYRSALQKGEKVKSHDEPRLDRK
ncbi:hypothetical protein LF95_04135 [Thalassospira sp. TSL5-1]|nr:hypothetical protein LF95_04135 [Thalassospira sp. TSL5-1]